jgi:hypothetical protein
MSSEFAIREQFELLNPRPAGVIYSSEQGEYHIVDEAAYDAGQDCEGAIFIGKYNGMWAGFRQVVEFSGYGFGISRKEFGEMSFSASSTVFYKGEHRKIAAVSFDDGLIGLVENAAGADAYDIQWVRCDDCFKIPHIAVY